MDEAHRKKLELCSRLRELGRVAVAFSAGVDSTFLLTVAREVLGDGVIAVTADVSSFPSHEQKEAASYCGSLGIPHVVVRIDQLAIAGFRNNPPDRCYLCKRVLFSEILRAAKEYGISHVVEGSNADDVHDYRPGMRALSELGILSPMKELGLAKNDIRALSKEMALPTWDKPSMACLATRFEYGELITEEKLTMVGEAERRLSELGFRQVRVRCHGRIARIEIAPSEFDRVLVGGLAEKIDRALRKLGFLYVALDLGGYKTGNMNRSLGISTGSSS